MEPIRRSEEELRGLRDKFIRDNKTLATWYKDEIRGYLAQRGWFVAGTLTAKQYQALVKAIRQNEETQIEDSMVRHVRSITERTASDTLAKWPNRKKILVDAFDAHSRERYTLSVLAMLAQADGIAHEILHVSFFPNNKFFAKAKKASTRNVKQDPLGKAFLGLLTEQSGLGQSTPNRDKDKGLSVSPLNWHGVLHGIDCDYPTECTV